MRLLAALLALLAASSAHGFHDHPQTVPAFCVASSHDVFSSSLPSAVEAVSGAQICAPQAADVVDLAVVLLQDQMSSTDPSVAKAYASFEPLFEKNPDTTAFVEYIESSTSSSSLIQSLVKGSSKDVRFWTASADAASLLPAGVSASSLCGSADELPASLNKISASEGVLNIIVASGASATNAVASVRALDSSSSKYALVHMGRVAARPAAVVPRKDAAVFGRELSQRELASTAYGVAFFPGVIAQGLLLSLILLIIVCVGFCCTYRLQSELAYSAEQDLQKKEKKNL